MNRLNYEKVFKTLVEETGNYLVNHSLRAMVLGVSGGIDSTVVAECDGADRMAQDYLLACGVAPKSINVYHMLKAPRYLANHNIPTIGGYTSDLQRDEAMTRNSDYDIAFIRKGKETSGTAQNILRRWTK